MHKNVEDGITCGKINLTQLVQLEDAIMQYEAVYR